MPDMFSTWSSPPEQLVLAPDAVHVWLVELEAADSTVERDFAILSTDEQQRAERFRFPGGKRRYTIARGSLRRILAAYLEVEPASIRFRYSGLGKPLLGGPHLESDLSFNVAHSHELALIAVARQRAIGVDIEHVRQVRSFLELAERYFSPAEVAALRSIEGESAQLSAFLTAWTRKEALLKATGKGLSISLDQVEVTMTPDEEPRLLRLDPAVQPAGPWQMVHLDVDSDYLAALCYHGQPARLATWKWPGLDL